SFLPLPCRERAGERVAARGVRSRNDPYRLREFLPSPQPAPCKGERVNRCTHGGLREDQVVVVETEPRGRGGGRVVVARAVVGAGDERTRYATGLALLQPRKRPQISGCRGR